jgi:hypothetical protein
MAHLLQRPLGVFANVLDAGQLAQFSDARVNLSQRLAHCCEPRIYLPDRCQRLV